MNQQEIVEWLQAELSKLFPSNGVRVYQRTILGHTDIYVLYTHNKTAAECRSGILENDRAYMNFSVNVQGGKWYIERPVCHMGRIFDDGTVKFRKISAPTQHAVCEKLLAWFVKHQAHIVQVGILGKDY